MNSFSEFCTFVKNCIKSEMFTIEQSMCCGNYKSYEDYRSACSKYAAYNNSCEIVNSCLKKFLGIESGVDSDE